MYLDVSVLQVVIFFLGINFAIRAERKYLASHLKVYEYDINGIQTVLCPNKFIEYTGRLLDKP